MPNLIMIVTADQYELPLGVYDNIAECSRHMHIDPSSLYALIRRHRGEPECKPHGRNEKYRIRRIEV